MNKQSAKCSYGFTLSDNCTGCTDPYSEGTHQGCTIQHGHIGCDLAPKIRIPPNAERTGDKGRVATCIHSEFGVCDTCKSDKEIVIQQAPLSGLIEEMEGNIWAFLTKECPFKHADRFEPLFKIVESAIEKAFKAGEKARASDEAGMAKTTYEAGKWKAYDSIKANVGFLRQWLNEKPIEQLVTNEDILTFLKLK